MNNINSLASIIIPASRENETLFETISTALKQKYKNKEIIIIWDNPDREDLTKKILKKFGKKIRLLKNKENLGLAGSLNRGIRNSKGEIIVILLDDFIPFTEKWLSKLMKPFSDEQIVAVGYKIQEYPPEVWKDLPKIGKELYWDARGTPKADVSKRFRENIIGLSSAYRKSALEKAGFFDNIHFKTAGEDTDMNIKMEMQGKIIPLVESCVKHVHSVKNEEDIYKKWNQYAKSFGVLFRRHGFQAKEVKGGLLRLLFPVWVIGKIIRGRKTNIKRKDLIFFYMKLNLSYIKNFLEGYIKGKQ